MHWNAGIQCTFLRSNNPSDSMKDIFMFKSHTRWTATMFPRQDIKNSGIETLIFKEDNNLIKEYF